MAPRLSGQTSLFGVVFFVSKSLLRIERQKKHEKFVGRFDKTFKANKLYFKAY